MPGSACYFVRGLLLAYLAVPLAPPDDPPHPVVTEAGTSDQTPVAKGAPDEHPNRELLDRIRQKLDRINQMMKERRKSRQPARSESKSPGRRPPAAPERKPDPAHAENTHGRRSETANSSTGVADPAPNRSKQAVAPVPSVDLPEPDRPRPQVEQTVPQSTQPHSSGSAGRQGPQAQKTIESIPLLEKPIDLIKAARSLIKGGQYREALRLYQAIPRDGVSAVEWQWLQYEQALCWKRLGNIDAAARIYRELASSATDPELREACRWQLESLQWRRQVGETLRQLSPAQDRQTSKEPVQ